MVAVLDEAVPDLIAQLERRLAKTRLRGYDLGPATTRRVQNLTRALAEIVDQTYNTTYALTVDELINLASDETRFQVGIIEEATSPVKIDMLLPDGPTLRSVVVSRPFQGKHLREWYSELGRQQRQQMKQAIRLGIAEGEGIEAITRRIVGTRARKYTDGILEIGRRNARAITRTAVNHVSAHAREALFNQNSKVVNKVKIVATLDHRTSAICRFQDGRVYAVNSGPRPPFHMNCRTTVVPVLKSWRELGVDLKEAPPGTRRALGGEVPEDVTYPKWFKSQSAALQRDVLGPSRYKMFRSGKTDVREFADSKGRMYTLKELRSRDPEIYQRALAP